MMKTSLGASMFAPVALLAAANCGGEPASAAAPTWVDDVEPIVRGNCFHCHGDALPDKDAKRWDFYFVDAADPSVADFFYDVTDQAQVDLYAGRRLPSNLFFPIAAEAMRWPERLNLTDGTVMPPVPATPLTDREKETLSRFAATPLRGARANNHLPTAAWFPAAPTLVVRDEDAEQVIGKLVCGGREVPIARTGAHTLPEDAVPPCRATLYDGQDTASVCLE